MIFFLFKLAARRQTRLAFFRHQKRPDLGYLVFGFFDNKLTDYACIVTEQESCRTHEKSEIVGSEGAQTSASRRRRRRSLVDHHDRFVSFVSVVGGLAGGATWNVERNSPQIS